MSLLHQIQRNGLALCSLMVALSALGYNTYRNEASERNRNVRSAEFEMLKNLGEVQQIIDFAHLRHDAARGDLTLGLSRVLLIRDLGTLTPRPVEEVSEKLLASWVKHGEQLATNADAAAALSEDVLAARRTVLASLQSLK
ncbi:MAG: hypothetical protein V4582_21995 [Pseudomonadota bacterium]